MTFGQIIKKLRREADMTQEELAERLSISGQAVSRWETDAAMPDISLLPVLANLFDVTTDYLLGVDITKKRERIDAITNEAFKVGQLGYHEKAVEILRAGLREYPSDHTLMGALADHLFSLGIGGNDGVYPEIIELGEMILAGCTHDETRHSAIQLLCYVYPLLGEPEKAEKLANTMPMSLLSREALLCHIYKGDALYAQKRFNFRFTLANAIKDLCHINTVLDSGELALTPEENIAVQHKALALLDILCEDGDYGGYIFHRYDVYTNLFEIKHKNGLDGALDDLEEAVKIAVEFDSAYNENGVHSSLLLCGLPYGDFCFSDPENTSLSLLGWLERKGYLSAVESTERGCALTASLRAHAAMR